MSELIKISEVSIKYDVSTRTLRYYEDAGLIESIRTEDYAYRLYDEKAIKRLEQILVLRKLNISIKDIQKIFLSNDVEVLLGVLSKKANEIDEEVSLLYQLKEIVVTFILQIERCDLRLEANLQHLYEQSQVIQEKIDQTEQEKQNAVEKLVEVTEKLDKMPDIRIVKLPRVRMARSGNTDLEAFDNWWSSIAVEQSLFPSDFMWFNPKSSCFEWLFMLPEHVTETNGYEVFEFQGGLYAVATARDEGEEIERVSRLIHKWVAESEDYELFDSHNHSEERYDMGHVITPKEVSQRQMDLFVPIIMKGV